MTHRRTWFLCSLSVTVVAFASSQASPRRASASGTLRLETLRLEIVSEDVPAGEEVEIHVRAFDGSELVRSLKIGSDKPTAIDLPVDESLRPATVWAFGPDFSSDLQVLRVGHDTATLSVFESSQIRFRLTGSRQAYREPPRVELWIVESGEATARRAACATEAPSDNESPDVIAIVACRSPRIDGLFEVRPLGHRAQRLGRIAVEGDRTFGAIPLRPGSQVRGRVSGRYDRQRPEVVLSVAGAKKGPLDRWHAFVGDDGWFEISGLPPGKFTAVAQSGGDQSQRVELSIGDDPEPRIIDDLRLNDLTALTVEILPRLAHNGEAWRLLLFHRNGSQGGAVLQRKSWTDSTEGRWHADRLLRGDYLLRLEDSSGSLWHTEPVALNDVTEHTIELESVSVVGQVRQGEEGLRTTLIFGAGHGQHGIRLATDEYGSFEGSLPREGWWFVERVVPRSTACERCTAEDVFAVGDIEIERGVSGVARVDIQLSDTELKGVVLASKKTDTSIGALEPVAGALVDVYRVDDEGQTEARLRTDESGEFSLSGHRPGHVLLSARHGEKESEFVPVELIEGDATEVEVILSDPVHVTVRVTASGVPVAGASVLALPVLNPGRGHRMTTDGSGTVTLRATPENRAMSILVAAQGFGAQLTHTTLESGVDFPVALTTASGSLRIATDRSFFLARGHAAVHVGSLMQQGLVVVDGSEFVLHSLEPGIYSVCLEVGSCLSSQLVPFGETAVDLVQFAAEQERSQPK